MHLREPQVSTHFNKRKSKPAATHRVEAAIAHERPGVFFQTKGIVLKQVVATAFVFRTQRQIPAAVTLPVFLLGGLAPGRGRRTSLLLVLLFREVLALRHAQVLVGAIGVVVGDVRVARELGVDFLVGGDSGERDLLFLQLLHVLFGGRHALHAVWVHVAVGVAGNEDGAFSFCFVGLGLSGRFGAQGRGG